MNQLSRAERAAIIRALVEGNSIRSVSRMTGAARNTITTLLVQLGTACSAYQHRALRNLTARRIECDEIWSFVGMKARWVNWLDLRGISTEPGAADYKNITVTRHTKFGFNKGTRVSLLDDPEGNTWCMKSFSLITFPDQNFADIANLGSRLKLPAGWKFRSVVLEQDLILTPDKTGTSKALWTSTYSII